MNDILKRLETIEQFIEQETARRERLRAAVGAWLRKMDEHMAALREAVTRGHVALEEFNRMRKALMWEGCVEWDLREQKAPPGSSMV